LDVATLKVMFDLARLAGRIVAGNASSPLNSPLDGRRLVDVPTSTKDDVARAAERARKAQPDWASVPIEQRMQVLLDLHDTILDRRDDLADLVQLEAGKSRLSAMEEVLHVALTARYYGQTARRYLHTERASGILPVLTRIDRHYVPKGLVGVIGPWNYPLTMAVSDGLAALAAGNAVLVKPDVRTPLGALAAAELLEECGLPAEVWQVVNGPGDAIGPALIDQADYVCFTGSTSTGRKVAEQCAGRLIGCSLELGGKNPALVLDDADLDKAVPGLVRASFSNAGQLCVSIERLYVARRLLPEFTERFLAAAAALRLGGGLDYQSDVGCLIDSAQVERVSAHVDDARDRGATVLTGGRARPDLGPTFYEPTVLSGVTAQMRCFTEETFGPVVSLYSMANDVDGIAQANASTYGLNASVWTRDHDRGRRVAARIECGTVNVNEGFAATFGSIDAPMGGMKQSGLGRRQAGDGIRRFVEPQSVATQSGVPIAPSFGLSQRGFVNAMSGAMRVLRKTGRA
jgi:succinate-semialdehyde dehydrogenase/glutarate-semialdehyde dehydrogenase